jgi:2-keto-4-pentenoate hydratase
MTMTQTTAPSGSPRDRIETAADRLREAYRAGPIGPLRDVLDALDVDGAYAIQAANTRRWQAAGRRIIGRKIGLTNPAVQRQLGVDQPDYGVLFDDMLVPNGGRLAPSKLLQPKAEGEIAFVLAQDLDQATPTRIDLWRSIAYALPAIEIVDSRFADWKITIADTIADNASSAYFVLGAEPRSLSGLDLETCGMTLSIDGAVQALGAGAACLGHPLDAVAWLARALAARGEPLRAGEVIMSGALGPMVALPPGARVRVAIGGLGAAEFMYREEST